MADCKYINDPVFDGNNFNETFLDGFIKDCDLFISLVVRKGFSRIFGNGDSENNVFKNKFDNNLNFLKESTNDLKKRGEAMMDIIELCENIVDLKLSDISSGKDKLCLNLFNKTNKDKLRKIKNELFEKINYKEGLKAVLITYDDFEPGIIYEGEEGKKYTFYRYIYEDNFFYSENDTEYGNLKGYYDMCKEGDDDDRYHICANNTFEFSPFREVEVSKTKIDRVFYIKDTKPTSSGGRTRKTRKSSKKSKTSRKTTRKPKSMRRKTNTKSKKRK